MKKNKFIDRYNNMHTKQLADLSKNIDALEPEAIEALKIILKEKNIELKETNINTNDENYNNKKNDSFWRKENIINQLSRLVTIGIFIAIFKFINVWLFLILVVSFIASYAFYDKLLKNNHDKFKLSLSLQTMHAVWISIGILYLQRFDADAVFFLLYFFLIAYVVLIPGYISVTILTLYQSFYLSIILLNISNYDLQSAEYKAVPIHLLVRLSAIPLMIVALYKFKKSKTLKNCNG